MMIRLRNWKHRQQITAHMIFLVFLPIFVLFRAFISLAVASLMDGVAPILTNIGNPQSPRKADALLAFALQGRYFCPSRIGMFPLDRKVQQVLHGFKISVITLKGFHFNEKVLKNQLFNKAVGLSKNATLTCKLPN